MPQAPQSYATHRHRPQATAVAGILWLLATISLALSGFGYRTLYLGLFFLLLSVFVLISISRLYTTKLQDRIIKLEMRVRTERLLNAADVAALTRLSSAQIIALRFASDPELPSLVQRAGRENLTPDQIKQAITSWVPDWDRT